jgi:hypothetical protein
VSKKNPRRVETVEGWAYRFYKRSDPDHHYGDVLSDVRMYVDSARHRFADALDRNGRNGDLAYTAKVEEEKTELARSGRGFREIVDDVDRYEKNPRHVYDFWDPRRREYLGTVYSDEPISEAQARKKMIGRLLSHGETLVRAKADVDATIVESFEAARERNPSNWREIGSSGDYPEWLRELSKRSGAYAIRKRDGGEVLYVGESHTDRLYKTITRHFQHWDGYTAGTTYRRGDVEIAVETTPAARAMRRQLDWIETLEPRDNRRRRNPAHTIPRRVAQLGTVLDLVVERDGAREIYREEIRGAFLLAPENGMERSPGGGRLYIVRGELSGKRPIEEGDAPRAQETYEEWHRSHGPDAIGMLQVPDAVDVPVGRAVRIGYKSDKFGGKVASYEHDFEDPQPRVYSTGGDPPRALVIVGGGFTLSGRGIVG